MKEVSAIVEESAKSFATCCSYGQPLGETETWICLCCEAYLRYPANVFVPILFGEAQVFVQAEAYIVPV